MFNRMNIGNWMLGCQVGSSHVDQVNRLVWQAPLWNILNRVVHSRFQHFIRQDDIVVLFIQIPNASKDLIGIFGRRSIDFDFIETTSQSCIFENGVSVLVLSSSPDNGQLPTRKRWLKNIRQALGPAVSASRSCSQDLMDFIKEEDNVAGFLDFIDQVLDIFFKATTILSTSFQTGNINRNNFLVLDCRWHITIDDSLSQSFYDSCLTNSGISNQYRIILSPAGKDFSSFLDFLIAPNDWIQLTITSFLSQIAT